MMASSTLYMANPDVSCREEGPDGALLFNPDTTDVLVINVTGLVVWEALAEPHTKEQVVEALAARCDNVPEDEVEGHVAAFVERLVDSGFVGTYRGPVT
jgi:hypothetical protein